MSEESEPKGTQSVGRPVTPKPPEDHISTLAKMIRQVEVDSEIDDVKKKRIKRKLGAVIGEFQEEIVG